MLKMKKQPLPQNYSQIILIKYRLFTATYDRDALLLVRGRKIALEIWDTKQTHTPVNKKADVSTSNQNKHTNI